VEITYHNRGAYYEAGFAKGLGIPVYFVVRKGFTSLIPDDNSTGRRIHFDIAQIMYRV
jgi:nucleoside 2-deoxyribosyltransferase